MDGTAIGANSASTGAFTTVTASTSVDITGSAGLILENDETITNSTDGTVAINGDVSAGTGSAAGVFKSGGNNDVTLKTGNSTTGVITITDGADGNIAITPNGTGEVDISKVDIDGGAVDGTAIGANSASTGACTTVTASTSVDITGSAGLILENDETITNSTDGTVAITATNTTVSGNLSGSGSISGFDANLNDQTGTTYTLASTDNGKVVTLNNGSAITVTIPTGLGDGFNCLLVQKGAGQVTISAANGVTVANRSSETKTAGQYATVSVINIGSEAYILSGDTGS